MTDFNIHTADTAPDAAKEILQTAQKNFGFVPNLYGVMAESPEILEAYGKIGDLFGRSSLSAVERNVVWLAINVEHNCHYCVPAHTGIAKSQGVGDDVIEALRNNTPIPDDRLEALRAFTLQVVRGRGEVSEADVNAFLAAGFTKRNILDVILGVSHKTISNYVNHFADTPVDAAFQSFAWTPPTRAAAE
ncbi:MAG: carboxymuconolactone decarboxylase family protein [Pseudomonadota bacterium]